MHRPQRTEAAQRLEARTARTLGLPLLRGLGGELNQLPRAQPAEAALVRSIHSHGLCRLTWPHCQRASSRLLAALLR